MIFISRIDNFLLDRLQMAAHAIHEKSGIKPVPLAQALGVGAIVAMMTRHWLLYGSMFFSVDLFWELFYPSVFLALTFWPDQQGDRGGNPKRFTLMPVRIFFFFLAVYMWTMLWADDTIVHAWVNYVLGYAGVRLGASPFWPLCVYSLATTLIWFELSFISVDRPPPRQVRAANPFVTT